MKTTKEISELITEKINDSHPLNIETSDEQLLYARDIHTFALRYKLKVICMQKVYQQQVGNIWYTNSKIGVVVMSNQEKNTFYTIVFEPKELKK